MSSTVLKGRLRKLGRRVWRFLTSVRMTLILILLLAGLTLIGTLIIQAPPDATADPKEYAWWLENAARPKLGIWTPPLDFLGLLDVFHSPWFLGVGSLLILSIGACSINRWKTIRSGIFTRRIKLADGFYERGANRTEISGLEVSLEEAGSAMTRALGRKGYRVRREYGADSLYIAGDKNRFFLLSTYLHHGSLVLLIVGFLLGSYLGFRYEAFMVPEGSVRDVGYGTNLSLGLDSFVDEYWPEGPPKDYRSDVTVYENGEAAKAGTVRVNHYLKYGGVRFYQSFFGPAAVLEVRNAEGQILYQDGVALGWLSGDEPFKRPTGRFSIADTGYSAYVVAPAQGYFDPLIKAGQMRVEMYRGDSSVPVALATMEPGVPREMAGMEVTFVRERQFSGFQVSQDPGNMVIWVASSLFVLGLVMVFYFPHRQVWARVHKGKDGKTRLLMRAASSKSFAVASDYQGLADQLDKELARKVDEG